jgi:TRAP transporter TAXI family solute receptor
MKNMVFKALTSVVLIVLVVCFAGLFSFATAPAAGEEVATIDVRLGTSKEGTAGYSAGVGLAACVKKRAPHVRMEAMPTAGSTASQRLMGKGDVDMAYGNTVTLRDANNNSGPFAKYPVKFKPLQGWYWYSLGMAVFVKADRTDINCFRDLAGKKYWNSIPGTGTFDVCRKVIEALGLWDKVKLVQSGPMELADAMQMGTVDAAVLNPMSNGRTANSLSRNCDTRLDLKAVVPSPEEIKIIKSISGISFSKVTANWMRPENRARSPECWAWQVHLGFHPNGKMSTQHMYEIEKAWVEYAKEDLSPVMALLKFYAEAPLEIQVAGIDEAKDVPVHPGAAKFLKEKGVWKDYWKIGKLLPGTN